MMYITDFTENHLDRASDIAMQNYCEERKHVPALPSVDTWPNLMPFAKNNLGVCAFSGDRMIGFLCCLSPFQNAFGSTDAVGVFSPMHANGTTVENRGEIYARMYQSAADKWVESGASSHAICLYSHDAIAQKQFFYSGFGLRCLDAVRPMAEIDIPANAQYDFCVLPPNEYALVHPLYAMLGEHMAKNPCFILRPYSPEAFGKSIEKCPCRFFVAKSGQEIIAFLKIKHGGETFITYARDTMHVDGAFCLPEHRGSEVTANLINYAVKTLKPEGFCRFSVDFESINPAAFHFWPKYFSVYTHGLVRRIDERVLQR